MNLDLTDEQQMLADAVRSLCEAHATPDDIRALEDTERGFDESLWSSLAGMDLLGLSLPEAHGGSGMGALETAVLHQELGRHLAPSPHLVSVVLGGGILASDGSDEQQRDWLPRVARGEAILTLGWYEADRSEGPEGIAVTVSADGDDLVVDGAKILVPFASSAAAILVLARSDAGVDLVLVPTDVTGITVEQTETLASDASFRVVFDGVRVPATARVGASGDGWRVFEAAMEPTLVALAASAVGGARRVHELAVEYAKERRQFGVPIGSFQGLAHPLADSITEIEGAAALMLEAAWVLDTHGDAGPLPAMAKQKAAEAFRLAGRIAHQVYGGIGFTNAIDVQLYFRRAKQLELQWFSSRHLLERIASSELDADVPFVSPDPGWTEDARHPVAR